MIQYKVRDILCKTDSKDELLDALITVVNMMGEHIDEQEHRIDVLTQYLDEVVDNIKNGNKI